MERHKILGDQVALYRRSETGPWHCYTFLDGKEWRKSTKEKNLNLAKHVATDWFNDLRARDHLGELPKGKSFATVADMFAEEYEATTRGHRSPKWVQGHKDRIRLHLLPYFKNTLIDAITAGTVQQYRAHRMTKPEDWNDEEKDWKQPARNTIHNEVVTLSLVLKTAHRHGYIFQVPDLSDPYKRYSKIGRRPWFTPNEYKQLYQATRYNASNPKNTHFTWHAEQLHDFVLFMANTGLRPDEVKQLEFRDIEIVTDEWSGDKILEIEVRGKRGVGYCKSMPGAVRPYERLRDRKRVVAEEGARLPKPTDKLFPNEFKKMFNKLLTDNDLKFDRDGKARTAYSLRHSYICFRLLEGADIYQIAKNCRTSVEMIEKHYAAHLKDMIDTSLINVRKPKKRPKVLGNEDTE
jgi:integrase